MPVIGEEESPCNRARGTSQCRVWVRRQDIGDESTAPVEGGELRVYGVPEAGEEHASRGAWSIVFQLNSDSTVTEN